jgi:hypothetical protein
MNLANQSLLCRTGSDDVTNPIHHTGYPRVTPVVKVKQSYYSPGQPWTALDSPGQPWTVPQDSRSLRRFQDNRHMKVVRLSALRTGRLYPEELFLIFVCVRG